MVFQVYIDDSGTGGGSPVFLLAGYETTASRWAEFTDRWRAVLAQAPSIAYFKASECFASQGQFFGFSPDQCEAKAAALALVIKIFADQSYVVSVKHDDFSDIFRGNLAPSFDAPYYFIAHDLIEQILAIYINERGRQRFELIFDRNETVEKRITDLYYKLRELSIGTGAEYVYKEVMPVLPLFADEKVALPLQSSDMLAWFMRRIFSGEILPQISLLAFDIIKEIHCNYFDTDTDFMKSKIKDYLDGVPDGYSTYYQLIKTHKTFDEEITRHNLDILESDDDYPTLASFSTKQMKQRTLVNSCPALDIPHLHTRAGNKCLGEGV